jgi:putative ABC transport system permease protein
MVLEAVIIALFFMGNSILAESSRGLRITYIESFTGDAFIHVQEDIDVSLFGAMTPSVGEFHTMRGLPDIDFLEDYFTENTDIEDFVPMLTGIAEIRITDYQGISPIFGINPDVHFSFFPGLDTGKSLRWRGNETGIVISQNRRKEIREKIGRDPLIGDLILLTSYQDGDFRIREVPIKGFYKTSGSSEQAVDVQFVDAGTLRELLQVTVTSDGFTAGEESQYLIDSDIDSLFAGFEEMNVETVEESLPVGEDEKEPRIDEVTSEEGWHFYLLKFNEGISARKAIRNINRHLREKGIEAGNWQIAAGLSAILVVLLRVVFNGGFILVVIAGVVAIVNMLTVSIVERTDEIGTLRALGAGRMYIRLLLFVENILMALFASLAGVGLAGFFMRLLNTSEITLNNSLLRSLFGSTQLVVAFNMDMAVLSLLVGITLGALSSAFPITLALRIPPVHAMQSD